MVAPGYYKTYIEKLRLAFTWACYHFFSGRHNVMIYFIIGITWVEFVCLFVCFVIFIFGGFGDDNYSSKFSSLFLTNKRTLSWKITVFSQEQLCVIRGLLSSSRKNSILSGYKDSLIGKNQCPGNIKFQQHL